MKVAYYSDLCRAVLMESMCDFEANFYNGFRLHYSISQNHWRVLDSANFTEPEVGGFLDHAKSCYSKCTKLEQLLSSEGDCFPASFNRRKTKSGSLLSASSSVPSLSQSSSYNISNTSLSKSSSHISMEGAAMAGVGSLTSPSVSTSAAPTNAKPLMQQFLVGVGWSFHYSSGETSIHCNDGFQLTLSADGRKVECLDVNGNLKSFRFSETKEMRNVKTFEQRCSVLLWFKKDILSKIK